MKLKILVFLAVFLFAGLALSETLSELSLKKANFQGIIAEGAQVEQCADFVFLKDALAEQNGVFIIFSAHALFSPTNEGTAKVKVFINESQEALAELGTADFKKEWARVIIPAKDLTEKNAIKVCAQTSNSITKVEVLDDSKIGYYKIPLFTLEKIVAGSRPIVGKETEVTLKATNIGSEAANAKISYWGIELNIAQITKGDSEFSGTISPGESVILHYLVKPKYAVKMDLASAILEFNNVFGEPEKIYSNRPTIYVKEPEFKVKAFFNLTEQKALQPGQSAKLVLTLRNDGLNDLENINVRIEKTQELTISKDSFDGVSLLAGESKSFEISASSIEEGSMRLGCTAEYSDYNLVQSKCPVVSLEFEKPKPNPLLGLAIVLVVIGAVIYAFIYKPEKKKQKEN